MRRLNWGCGRVGKPGWINADLKEGRDVQITGDILDGLPLDENSLDYVVSIHALPEIAYRDLIPVLRELRRVLKPGGVLRLCLPDLNKGIEAYLRGDRDYFLIPEEAVASWGGRFIVHMLWYGYSRTMFTPDFVEELLVKAGFARVELCRYRESPSGLPGITELDNRKRESLYVEAVK